MNRLHRYFCFLLLLLFTVPLVGQEDGDFENRLEQLAKTNARGYLSPLVTSMGIGLNSGLYRTADIHGLFGFDIAINLTGISIPDAGKKYTFDTSPLGELQFNVPAGNQDFNITLNAADLYPPVENAPTFFGSEDPPPLNPDTEYAEQTTISQIASQTGASESDIRNQFGDDIRTAVNSNLQPLTIIPPGFDLSLMAVPSLQGSIGLPYETEFQIRLIPTYQLMNDVGDFSLLGLGGRISVDQFIPIPFFPVDIAAGAFFQRVKLGPVEMNSSILHAEVSKSIPVLTVYGGLGLETSSLTAEYAYESPMVDNGNMEPNTISLTVDGENRFRTTLGVRLKFLLLTVNADYNIGTYNSANLGVGITFR